MITKESQSNECDLFDEDEHAVAAMILFFYHGDYDWAAVLPFHCGEGIAMLHVRVFTLAQKYLIKDLEPLAYGKAIKAFDLWDNIRFANAVREAFIFTQDRELGTELRKAAIATVKANAATLFSDNETYFPMQEVFAKIPELMREVVGGLANEVRQKRNYIEQFSAAHELAMDNLGKANKALKTEIAQVHAANTVLGNSNGTPIAPHAAVPNTSPMPKWYKCPNCATLFSRCISLGSTYHHSCYSVGWVGKLNVSQVVYSGQEWEAHVWK